MHVMRIGIKILSFALAIILLTGAAHHQEKADVFEFDLVLGVQCTMPILSDTLKTV